MVTIKYGDLSAAFDFVSFAAPFEHRAFLSLDTGEIYWISETSPIDDEDLPDDLETSDRYIAIPHKNDLDLGNRLALLFAEEHLAHRYASARHHRQMMVFGPCARLQSLKRSCAVLALSLLLGLIGVATSADAQGSSTTALDAIASVPAPEFRIGERNPSHSLFTVDPGLFQPATVEELRSAQTFTIRGEDESASGLTQPTEQKPPEPKHTGFKALLFETASDFNSFPRRRSTWVILGIGGAAAAIAHPFDDEVNEKLVG